jgi:hypothetical protein
LTLQSRSLRRGVTKGVALVPDAISASRAVLLTNLSVVRILASAARARLSVVPDRALAAETRAEMLVLRRALTRVRRDVAESMFSRASTAARGTSK